MLCLVLMYITFKICIKRIAKVSAIFVIVIIDSSHIWKSNL